MSDDRRFEETSEQMDCFEPLSDDLPMDFDPEEYDEMPRGYALTERILSVSTVTLSALLLAGSLVFWWYFVRRLSICPVSLANRELYPPMLFCCAGVTAAFTLSQIMRRQRPGLERWLINLCFSGAVTTLIMVLFNTFTLGRPFEWADVLSTACFSVSGCALPAAVWFVLWAAVCKLISHIRRENRRGKELVAAAVRAQCEGRF